MSSPWREPLPTSVEVGGVVYEIRSDYRAALDICAALQDPELSGEDKAVVALDIFYPAFDQIPPAHYREAVERCYWFLNCGREDGDDRKAPKLVDWEQDFPYIVAPLNRLLGKEIRLEPSLHWWTLMSAFMEIGDCTFAQIVRIRNLKARGKKLDKSDQEWYRQNRDLVDIRRRYTEAEDDLVKQWT